MIIAHSDTFIKVKKKLTVLKCINILNTVTLAFLMQTYIKFNSTNIYSRFIIDMLR